MDGWKETDEAEEVAEEKNWCLKCAWMIADSSWADVDNNRTQDS